MESKEEKLYKFSAKFGEAEYNFTVSGCNTLEEAKEKLSNHLIKIVEDLKK